MHRAQDNIEAGFGNATGTEIGIGIETEASIVVGIGIEIAIGINFFDDCNSNVSNKVEIRRGNLPCVCLFVKNVSNTAF